DPSRHEVRLRAVRLAMSLGRHQDALEHLDALGAAGGWDGERHALYAQCLEAGGRYKEARGRFAKAVASPPYQVETFVRYALLLRRRLNDPAAADKAVARMTGVLPTAQADLAACSYWQEFDRTKAGAARAAAALAEAQKRAPDDADVLLKSAALAG